MAPSALGHVASFTLRPPAPFDFDTTTCKPSSPPDPTLHHEPGRHWQTMRWNGQVLGVAITDTGTRDEPSIQVNVHSRRALPARVMAEVEAELRWRFDLDTDLSWFCRHFAGDSALAGPIERIGGMRVSCAYSLYEWSCTLALLQMATIGRSSKMFHALLDAHGQTVTFDGHTLQAFWEPEALLNTGEQALRELKVGYRAKSLIRISQAAADGRMDEDAIRAMDRDQARKALLKLYGIGPASVGYLLFGTFHHYDALDVIPPWDAKLYSRLFYDRPDVPTEQILTDVRARYGRWRALASAYMTEDLFARHRDKPVEWLATEIRM